MKIRPNEAMAPVHRPDIGICGLSSSAGGARLPKMIDTAIRARAISPGGKSPAMNNPPIDRLATKPRRIRLMQGGQVSAMAEQAGTSAPAAPGLRQHRRRAGV